MLSAPRLVTPFAGTLVPIEQLRDFLRIDGEALDVEISGYLAASAGEIEQATGVRLGTQVVEVLADRWSDLEHLHVGPVRAIEAVKYQDREGAMQELDEGTLELFGAELDQGIRPAFRRSVPRVRSAEAVIAVQLEVGLDPVPQPILWALLLMCRAKMDGVAADVDHLLLGYRINA